MSTIEHQSNAQPTNVAQNDLVQNNVVQNHIVQQRIREKLAVLTPLHLEVINESFMHSVPPGSETHFNVVIVAPQFDGKRQVARHQSIYRILAEELAGGVHALALHTYTQDEWVARAENVPASPECLGGSKHNR